jgi:hypothetical protein
MAAERAYPDRLEPDSTNPRLLFAIAGAVLLLLAVAFGMVIWFYKTQVPERGAIVPKEFPSPRLIQDETDQLHRVQAEQRARLQGYRWVDRDKGLIAIPIGEAMRMIAAKGADGYAPIDTAPQGAKQ